ncbi:MAG: sugar phosphate isomerase/epimerase [Bacteroidales bacterium]|nr:sugar phosphate isomerase/epimerase [Bacteroidales bacterium]
MLLGTSSPLSHSTPQEWAERHVSLGLGSVVFPLDCNADPALIDEYAKAADDAGLVIAEVGIWKNMLAADPQERQSMTEYAIGQLRMADRIGAKCCVNVIGTPYGPRWDGGYRDNFSEEAWQLAVAKVREIIDAVHPVRTKFSIESMPWMIPSSPDEYLRLIEEVDRPEFGVHLDVVNMVTSPERYFFNDRFLHECFDKLGGKIVSCHLKDVRLLPDYTFQLQECACGEGRLDIGLFISLADKESERMPMIIEHLADDEAYLASIRYIKERF